MEVFKEEVARFDALWLLWDDWVVGIQCGSREISWGMAAVFYGVQVPWGTGEKYCRGTADRQSEVRL